MTKDEFTQAIDGLSRKVEEIEVLMPPTARRAPDASTGVQVLAARDLIASGRRSLQMLALKLGEASEPTEVTPTIDLGRLLVDRAGHRATFDGRPVELTNKSFAVLAIMAGDPTRVFSKAELVRAVWGPECLRVQSRTPDAHVCRVRTALRAAGAPRGLVVNVWGVGWRLADDPSVLASAVPAPLSAVA
jgi:DNA-binding response OmpR family regulator